jgi:15,16-dihydrobiliverdin:ferredoxin oxidoreductase
MSTSVSKALLLLLFAAENAAFSNAWLSSSSAAAFSSPTHQHQHQRRRQRRKGPLSRTILMDIEQEEHAFEIRPSVSSLFRVTAPLMEQDNHGVVEQISKKWDMPWKTSIDNDYDRKELFYMPFWEWQLQYMADNLTNLRVVPTVDASGLDDLTYVENPRKKKRMITLCFSSDEYRLIRLTLLDAGSATQVFTSLWYPRANLPVLGIDFLQFNNGKRHLTVVDFQPIQSSEGQHDANYEHLMQPIRDKYPSLQHDMTDRFYDETQFFSNQMLLGKGDDSEYVWNELVPAYQDYVQTHVDLVKNTKRKMPLQEVLKQHKAYDDYSSERDPAHGLLAASFGLEYADKFVYDVLFPLSTNSARKGSSQKKD